MKNKTDMHRTQLFLPKDLYKELISEARSEGVTLSEVVRQILFQHTHRQSRKDSEHGTKILLDMVEMAKSD